MKAAKPRGPLYGRLLSAGSFACIVGAGGCAAASLEPSCQRFEGLLSLAAVLLGAGIFAFFVASNAEVARQVSEECDRLFGVEDRHGFGHRWERWPRPSRKPRPRILDAPRDSAFWMKRLAERYARLARLEALRAPEIILEAERRMIRDAIAQLSPTEALAVMRSWPELASERAKKRGPASTPDKSN